ncbi:hypothetical protein GCM10010350_84480 [Streptomyces galilaeus]|nr:hypothetical protein GCM10010350_84480 [Streptomyces galilaeus]
MGYDADSGQLTVCPESSWATKTRLEQTRIVDAANKAAAGRSCAPPRILAPGSIPAPEPDDTAPTGPDVTAGPAKTREAACDGYHRALTTHREAAPPSRIDLEIAEAVERQNRAMRERGSHRAACSPSPVITGWDVRAAGSPPSCTWPSSRAKSPCRSW